MTSKLDRKTISNLGKLSSIQFLRLSGVFFIIPLIAVYAGKFTSNDILIGLSLGAYEISMAIMQVPSGYFSRITGKKNYIYVGLTIFIIGNLLSYFASNIWLLILGRLVAGLGAISSPISSLAIDMVPEDRKNSAMAITGVGIGFAFLGGIGLSPIIAAYIGIQNFFLISSFFGILAIIMVPGIPEYNKIEKGIDKIFNQNTFMIFAGTFLLSILSFIIFYNLQIYVSKEYGLYNYGLILFLGLLISGIIAVSISEGIYRRRKFNIILLSSLLIMVGSIVLFTSLLFHPDVILLTFSIIPFFTGFSIYEISAIPLLTRFLGKGERNLSFGLFYAFQYTGNGIGAIIGGAISAFESTNSILISLSLSVILGVLSGLLYITVSSRNN
ncbi:MAG: MFS transporter [Cuniculiplasma sp.]